MKPTRVLFLCIGNSCRSPMAEGFARTYGTGVLQAQSAGLSPAIAIAPLTHKVMLERNIDLGGLFPKNLGMVSGDFDLIINMSGQSVPVRTTARIENWDIVDPIGEPEEVYRQVRDEIELRVMRLVRSLHSRKPPQSQNQRHEEPARGQTP